MLTYAARPGASLCPPVGAARYPDGSAGVLRVAAMTPSAEPVAGAAVRHPISGRCLLPRPGCRSPRVGHGFERLLATVMGPARLPVIGPPAVSRAEGSWLPATIDLFRTCDVQASGCVPGGPGRLSLVLGELIRKRVTSEQILSSSGGCSRGQLIKTHPRVHNSELLRHDSQTTDVRGGSGLRLRAARAGPCRQPPPGQRPARRPPDPAACAAPAAPAGHRPPAPLTPPPRLRPGRCRAARR